VASEPAVVALVAEFDLDGTEEIKRWVLSFGKHAEVIEPEELHDSLRGELEAMSMKYESHGTGRSVTVRHAR